MTVARVDEVPDPDRDGYWLLPHWNGPHLHAGLAGPPHDLRLRERSADQVAKAWASMLQGLPGLQSLIVSPQVHGTTILVQSTNEPGWHVGAEADGHLIETPGVGLAVTVADCVPVYLQHPGSGWVGLLHAGWRGVADGILPAALARLAAVGIPAREVVIHCGISICKACYEVSSEVFEVVTGHPIDRPAPVDLRTILAQQAEESGASTITLSGLCSAEEGFYSHRGSRGAPERMAAFVGRRLA